MFSDMKHICYPFYFGMYDISPHVSDTTITSLHILLGTAYYIAQNYIRFIKQPQIPCWNMVIAPAYVFRSISLYLAPDTNWTSSKSPYRH